MATTIREATLLGAGLAMKELRRAGNPYEAQVSMALMAAYLCSQYQWDPGAFTQVLLNNMTETAKDPTLMKRVIERVHALSKGTKEEPEVLYSSGDDSVEEVSYRVGDLLRMGKHPRLDPK